jgi:hypothetical protein
MMKRYLATFLIYFLANSCGPKCYPDNGGRPNYSDYKVVHTYVTPIGLNVDDPKHELDVDLLDRTTLNVLACLQQFKDSPLTNQEKSDGFCLNKPDIELKSCLTIKVAPDWRYSPTSNEQLTGICAPDASCVAKGLHPTGACSCQFRAVIQDNCTIITTPNLKIYPAQLTQLLMSCDNGWTGRMTQCSDTSNIK